MGRSIGGLATSTTIPDVESAQPSRCNGESEAASAALADAASAAGLCSTAAQPARRILSDFLVGFLAEPFGLGSHWIGEFRAREATCPTSWRRSRQPESSASWTEPSTWTTAATIHEFFAPVGTG